MDEKARLARYPGPWKWEDGKFTVEIRGHGGTMTAERADTEAMEAARRIVAEIIENDGWSFTGDEVLLVARALLQQRESIIEECAKVAEKYVNTPYHIPKYIRALAARKETPDE